MLEEGHPGSPSPTFIEEYAEDPDLEGINWAAISVLYTPDDEKPTILQPPCKNFNEGLCLCQATCPYPHVCSRCFNADHSVSGCPRKREPTRSHQKKKEATWDENVSCSPCARASLEAAPLPPPPPIGELPPELVQVVRDHPELFKIVTPIEIDVFEGLLALHPNQSHVKSVITCLRKGFWPYARVPKILTDESWKQRPLRRGPKKKFLDQYLKEEIRSGRFSRSFGKKLLPGMACMPVHVAQDQNRKKFRLIYDHSAGENSLNSLIPECERGAPADRMDTLIRALRNRGLDLADIVLFKSDVSRAFRILPMSPYWQALQAVKINGQYYIDRCNSFGNAGSQRLFCAFYSLVLWIAENVWRLTDIFSYVDDNFSWEYADRMKYYRRYNKKFPEKQARLLEIWDCLGIPHALEKQEFDSAITIIGFHVDLRHMRITVSKKRLEKLMNTLSEICTAPIKSLSLHECQMLAGSLNWIFEVNPLLRPGVVPLHKEMAKASQLYGPAEVALTKQVVSSLRWLASQLERSKGVHLTRIGSWGPVGVFHTAYLHACTEGFGIWFPSMKKAFYHRFAVPEQNSYVSLIHAFGMICAIYIAARSCKNDLTGRPRKLVVFTGDKFTFDMFDQLRGRDELHHVLLLGMELLTKADLDYSVSQAGKEGDSCFAARLAREPKKTLDQDYPHISVRTFVIPPKLARRARWDMNEEQGNATGSTSSGNITETPTAPNSGYTTNGSIHSADLDYTEYWLVRSNPFLRQLTKRLTCYFR